MALAKTSCLCVHEAVKNSKTAEKPPLKAMPCGTLRALAARENLIEPAEQLQRLRSGAHAVGGCDHNDGSRLVGK